MSFPLISNRQEFIDKIAHKDEIGVSVRDGYTVIAYNVAFPDTFDIPEALECRGIVFCNKTGRVLRRPLHKFFNVNEKEHTQVNCFDGAEIIQVTNKLDGAMVSPFVCDDKIVWGTKRVSEEFSEYLENHPLTNNPEMIEFVRYCDSQQVTPIFEFHDPDFQPSQIVLKYDEAFLTLLAIRDNVTGRYLDKESFGCVKELNIPVVAKYAAKSTHTSLKDLINNVSSLESLEGIVVDVKRINDDVPVKLKIKTAWYVKRHKIKELFRNKHITAQLILDCCNVASVDDIMPYIDENDKGYLEEFSLSFHKNIKVVEDWVVATAKKYESKKDYGLSGNVSGHFFSSIVFNVIDSPNVNVFDLVTKNLKSNHIQKNIRFCNWENEVQKLKGDI